MTKRSHGIHVAKSDIGWTVYDNSICGRGRLSSDIGWTVYDNSICGRGRLSGAFATKREAVMRKRRLAQALQSQRDV